MLSTTTHTVRTYTHTPELYLDISLNRIRVFVSSFFYLLNRNFNSVLKIKNFTLSLFVFIFVFLFSFLFVAYIFFKKQKPSKLKDFFLFVIFFFVLCRHIVYNKKIVFLRYKYRVVACCCCCCCEGRKEYFTIFLSFIFFVLFAVVVVCQFHCLFVFFSQICSFTISSFIGTLIFRFVHHTTILWQFSTYQLFLT